MHEDLEKAISVILNKMLPELLHFLSVLSDWKDRWLALATKWCQHKEEFIQKHQKDDEESVWSWWHVQKNNLRDTMVAEANRKHRQLERKKRSLESHLGGMSSCIIRRQKLKYLQSVQTPSILQYLHPSTSVNPPNNQEPSSPYRQLSSLR